MSRGLAMVFSGLILSATASANVLEASLDQLVIYRNGTLYVNDTFSDGLPPPSGNATIGPGGSLNYFTQGSFTEAGGKLTMHSETQGQPVFRSVVNANTGAVIRSGSDLARQHHGRVLSNTSQDPLNSGGFKRDFHTFEVLALYDLVTPTGRGDNYGLRLLDNFPDSGPATRDRLNLSVSLGTASGTPRIVFFRNDGTTNPQQNFNFGSHALETGHSQIALRLSRPSIDSNEIVASYAYVDGPNVGLNLADPVNLGQLSFNVIANGISEPSTIFNDYLHTRVAFRQLALDEDNRFDFARLTTGSPVSISQRVATGSNPSYVTFNYRFETTTGVLTVKLGDDILGTVDAPASVNDDFLSASFLVDGGLLGQSLLLALELDGPAGSKILLDSVGFAGLVNANFATGDLTGWNVIASGTGGAGILTVVAIPEPETYVLMVLGLGALTFAARRRKQQRLA